MTRHEDFRTSDIELAAALMTATNRKPLAIMPGVELVEFIFPGDEVVQSVVMKYAAGRLILEVKRLAANRTWLYRQVQQVKKRGSEVLS
ncbi:hypothetical protein [Geotalea toluenoxydans]|uniref:hypothetical protein n=1 Tax=Geotalea toluenoxydans TaxID=421624 RepID=UPI0006D01C05|nr:hypothetical protein [Geotalea toluenoxydans]